MANRTPQNEADYEKMDDKVLHSAAIIDAEGHEVPITDNMIDDACEKLAKKADQFYHEHSDEES